MNRLLIATLSIGALTIGVASAADIPAKAPRTVISAPACAQFAGGYVGINGGWAYHDQSWVDRDSWVDNFGIDWALGTVRTARNGGTAGAQIGYNWQRRCTVFGIEIDANWTSIKGTKDYSPDNVVGSTDLTLTDRLRWFGTARTRAGVVVDDLLIYATGGLAFGSIKHTWTLNDPVGAAVPTSETFSSSNSRWGWTAGVGTEWAWSNNLSIKAEALYVQFTERRTSGASPNGPDALVRFDSQDSMWVSRIGLNYRWGGAPVAARY